MMMGTSLHTLVQMVDNGLGMTIMPEMAIASGLLEHTDITARPLRSERAHRDIALVWRKNSPREKEFRLRSEEHTSELQSLMRISYAVFCLKKKKQNYVTTQLSISSNTLHI